MGRLKTDIKALEAQCLKQQQLVQQLQQENEAFKQKESALLSTLLTLQCGMSALGTEPAAPAQQDSSSLSSPRAAAGSLSDAGCTSAGTAAGHDSSPALSPSIQPLPSTADTAARSSPTSGDWSDGYGGSAAQQQQQQQQPVVEELRARLLQLEQMLQGALHEVCCLAPSAAPYRDLATTTTTTTTASSSSSSSLLPTVRLRALATDPARVAGFLGLSTAQRSRWLAGAVTRMGLLLPKYEAVPAARAQVDALAEEVAARGLTYAWLEPSSCITHDLNRLNMETGQQEEHYPDGMWQFVLQSLDLSPQQALSMQALWSRVKAAQASLLGQHEALSQQLGSLQAQQQQQQRLFDLGAEALPIMQVAQALALCEPERPFATHQQQQTQRQMQQQTQQQQQQTQQQQQQRRVECDTPTQQGSRGGAPHHHQHHQHHHYHVKQEQPPLLPPLPQQQQQPPSPPLVKLEQQQPQHPQQQLLQQPPPPPQQQQSEPLLPGSVAPGVSADVLLVHPCRLQRRLEGQLSRLRASLVVLEKLMLGQVLNGLSLRQLAVLLVASWPFCPDLMALYGVLDDASSPN